MIGGRYPDRANLVSGHSGPLTRSLRDGLLDILDNDSEYNWGRIFPDVGIEDRNALDQTINLGQFKRFKTFTYRALDASLTGATRAHGLLCADDLVSGIEQAMNPLQLEKLWHKYTSDLKSRREGDWNQELHIATRWSVHDVIGRLERELVDDPSARFVVMKALNEDDESNFDFDYGVGFTTSYFHGMRDMMDEVSWRCLYMNEPIEREGLVYRDDELRRFYELPEEEPDAVLAVCDTKDTGPDYACMLVAYVYGDDHYIADTITDNGLPSSVDARLADCLLRNHVQQARFESNSAGGRVADKVQSVVRDKGGITHITKRFSKGNKETRIIVNSAWVKEHCLFLDKSVVRPRSDYDVMLRQLTAYTQSGKNKHDDVPMRWHNMRIAQSVTRPAFRAVRNPLKRQ